MTSEARQDTGLRARRRNAARSIGTILARRWRARSERGFIGEIAALVATTIILTGALWALGNQLSIASKAFTLASNFHHRSDLELQLLADARHAMAITIPATDVNGLSNADGHEVDFYTRDSGHNPYFWAYTYTAPTGGAITGTVQHYSFTNPNTHAGLTAVGPSVAGFTGFAAAYVNANATGNPTLTAAGVTNIAPQNLGYTGIAASNQIVALTMTTPDANLTTDLLPAIGPTGFTVITGGYWQLGPLSVTPTQVAMVSGGAASCYFPDNSLQNPCAVSVSEQYYTGQFTIAPGTCGAIASESTNSLTGNGTSAQAFDVRSIGAGTCQIIVSDDHGGSIPITVTVWGPLQVTPARLDFHLPGSTTPTAYNSSGVSIGTDNNGTISASEPFYTGSYSITDGDANGQNTCSPAVTATVASGNTWTLTAAQTIDACDLTVHDGHGGVGVVAIHVGAPLTVAPNTLTFTNGTGSAAQTFTVSEQVYTGAFATNDNCNGAFSYSPTSGGGDGVQSIYTVTPTTPTAICVITISDTRGQSVTVAVNATQNYNVIPECDPNSPPAPATTILSIVGNDEYISNGTTCAASPAPSPSPQGGGTAGVYLVPSVVFNDTGFDPQEGQYYATTTGTLVYQIEVLDSNGNALWADPNLQVGPTYCSVQSTAGEDVSGCLFEVSNYDAINGLPAPNFTASLMTAGQVTTAFTNYTAANPQPDQYGYAQGPGNLFLSSPAYEIYSAYSGWTAQAQQIYSAQLGVPAPAPAPSVAPANPPCTQGESEQGLC